MYHLVHTNWKEKQIIKYLLQCNNNDACMLCRFTFASIKKLSLCYALQKKEILHQIICTSYIASYYEITCSIDSMVGNMKNKLEGNTS